MSRIGKAPIQIPGGVNIEVSKGNLVQVKGPKGTLKQQIDPDLILDIEDGVLSISRPTEQKRHKAMHGLYRSLISNLVKGVTEGYKKELELVGVGFKAANTGNVLDLALGYSHNIIFEIPKELTVSTTTEKGQNPKIFLESADKQLIGQVAAKIRGLRKPEPYKGKGVRYSDEVVRRKAGKAAGK
jgi:large subunit ribosomal protein L6